MPSGPINNFEQVFADPHVQARGMRVKTKHKFEPELSLIRNALTFSGTPIETYRAPPLLGEHTEEVLGASLGYDAQKIEALRKQGIILDVRTRAPGCPARRYQAYLSEPSAETPRAAPANSPLTRAPSVTLLTKRSSAPEDSRAESFGAAAPQTVKADPGSA